MKAYLEEILDTQVLRLVPISGGDINEARLVETERGKYFLKMNCGANAAAMLNTEAKGLEVLRTAGKIYIPKVYQVGMLEQTAFLLLEYIEPSRPSASAWENFGRQVAQLHHQSNPTFGLDHDNFIGSLPQSNQSHDSWTSFYIDQRLQPQIDLAIQQQAIDTPTVQSFELLFKKLDQLCPQEPPALTHGDLWNGNFLMDSSGTAVLIDPAVSFAHREMDLAMTQLFGGFAAPFYQAYQEVYPLQAGFAERVNIYQLYYLLVHVNIFGGSYLRSVQQILQRYQ